MREPAARRAASSGKSRHVEHVMGTVVSFELHTPVPESALDAAIAFLHHADRTFSMYKPNSDMARLSRGEVRIERCHPDVAEVLALCGDATRQTDGYFSATMNGRVDPTGLVKAWAVQRASEILVDAGSSCHVVNGGGDVQLVGVPDGDVAWRVGIANPLVRGDLIAVALCAEGAVATSGTSERGLHILDPIRGQAASHFASVSILAPTLIDADVFATAAFARGESAIDWISSLPNVEGLFVGPGTRSTTTPGFPCERSAE
jgi:thiamine biosynthesis lipoprotein